MSKIIQLTYAVKKGDHPAGLSQKINTDKSASNTAAWSVFITYSLSLDVAHTDWYNSDKIQELPHWAKPSWYYKCHEMYTWF